MLTNPPLILRVLLLGLFGFILGSGIQQAADGHWFGVYTWLFTFILAFGQLSEAFYRSRFSKRPARH